jgi:predicted enzyme related to lactoylglutathione lyase
MNALRIVFAWCLLIFASGCASFPKKQSMTNPVFYFEIPVRDMDRAISFYSKTFGVTLERQDIDGNEMALSHISLVEKGPLGHSRRETVISHP